jgi:outer membrane receptor protein involved in Fe transport
MKQADGQRVENGRDWRVNLVTRYSFSEGLFRGAFVGTGFRYRSPQVLGYLASLVPNEFPLAGSPERVLVPARNAPIDGKTIADTELFLGYSRRIMKRYHWRVQLNVRNIFANQDPMAQRANVAAGFTTVYAVPDPRTFVLTNTVIREA